MSDLSSFGKKYTHWEELRLLSAKGAGGLRNLSEEELVRFIRLYRKASADLAALSAAGTNPHAVTQLNVLVARAYGQLYSSPRRRFGEAVSLFIWTAADTVRRRRNYVWTAIALFLAFAVVAALLLAFLPESRTYLVNPMMEPAFDHWKSGTHPERTGSDSIAATFGYASNNPLVAIMANAASVVTAGAFGVYSLWNNGALLGALTYEVALAGHLAFLLISIFPHGVTELGGIFISVGAGLLVGGAIISPGRKSRTYALKSVGKDAAIMLGISLIMIFIAAPIEGFFSFNPRFPLALKAVFGTLMLIATLSFFSFYGKGSPPRGFTLEELRPEDDGESA